MVKKLPKLLIVDDESEVTEVLCDALAPDRDIYEIITADNGSEALAILNREEITLVLSDVMMPEINGIELLDKIKRRFPDIGVILMSGYGTDEMRATIKQIDCLRFIEKPFAISELRQLLRENINKQQQGFTGTLNNIELIDIIQMCCLSVASMAIQVTQNLYKGVIVISDGEIIHAVCDNKTGTDAFHEIISWEGGSFQTLRKPSETVVSIKQTSQFLLMEAARLKDEKSLKVLSEEKPEPASRPAIKLEAGKRRVLIVDDSAMMCKVLMRLLSANDLIEVIGTAQNGEEALEKINALKPDVITLDVNMPIMGGSTALKHIMLKNPGPVVIISSISSISHKGLENIFDFLRLGAVDFIAKPSMSTNMAAQEELLVQRICLAASAHVENFKLVKAPPILSDENTSNIKSTDSPPSPWNGMLYSSPALVIINSGMGGYAELIRLVPQLNNKMRAVVIALHTMPSEFVNPFCEYLNKRSLTNVVPLLPPHIENNKSERPVTLKMGNCYIGTNQLALNMDIINGEYGLLIKAHEERPQDWRDKIQDHPENNFDRFLYTVADSFPGVIITVLLSGAQVGNLEGLRCIKTIDGWIISQKSNTCMVTPPLEKALDEQLVTLEASSSEIANMILTA
ncbi:response regulator [Desulfococcaceae bacterium HSG9]|nr:response regulator [Desulfococcaceae bacterium HSG9]